MKNSITLFWNIVGLIVLFGLVAPLLPLTAALAWAWASFKAKKIQPVSLYRIRLARMYQIIVELVDPS